MAFTKKIGLVFIGALFWALSGGLFGALFEILLSALAPILNVDWVVLLLATTLAATVTASFFGAMQIAVVGTMVGVLSAIGYLMVFSSPENPLPLFAIALVAGLVSGAVLPSAAAVSTKPLGQALSGLVSGMIAGALLLAVLHNAGSEWPPMVVAAVAVALVGVLFVILSRLILVRCSERMTATFSGPVVAAIISVSVSAIFWFLVSPIAVGTAPATASGISSVFAQVPDGLLGGALGGACGGAMLEILGISWGDYRI